MADKTRCPLTAHSELRLSVLSLNPNNIGSCVCMCSLFRRPATSVIAVGCFLSACVERGVVIKHANYLPALGKVTLRLTSDVVYFFALVLLRKGFSCSLLS